MADQMRPTPRSSILGLFSDLVNLPLQYMNAPERTQQSQGAAQFLYSTGIPQTLERMSYGDSLFTGSGGLGGTTRMRPETADALMNVAPMAKPAAVMAGRTGRAVGRMAGEEINAAMIGQSTSSLLGQITPKPKQIFIGESARTWNKANANKFIDMEEKGMSPIEMWKKTGTFRTADGALKQEIPDNLARLRTDFNAAIANKANNYVSGTEGAIGGMLEHSELFKAYPDLLQNLRYTAIKQPEWLPESSAGAQYSRTIGGKEKISTSTKTEEDALSKLMHELQHAVQTRENWQSGGLESQFKDTPEMTAFQQYRALPGEIEARAVEARRTMTPQQRQEIIPLSNYELPIESVIYRDPFGSTTR